ncbi:MAG: phage tail protein [Mogibacterium sp.]|nr:phage tail protein [Mogibacterium sp.]
MNYSITTDAGAIVYDPRVAERQLVSATLTQELNKADVLRFTIFPTAPAYGDIDRLKSTLITKYGSSIKSRCRMIDDVLGWNNERDCLCEGELAFFNDSIQRPFVFPQDDQHATPEDYLTFLVSRHNEQVSTDRQFTVGTVTVTDPNNYISRSDTEYSTTWALINEGLLDTLGGYLWVRHENGVNYLDYLADFSTLANQPIKAGVNLLGISTERKGAEIATAILPLGAKDDDTQQRLTIEGITDYTDTDICKTGDIVYSIAAETQYGSRIVKVVTWDDVNVDTNLLSKAIAELAIVRQLPSTVTITAADLSAAGYNFNTFSIGTYVQIEDGWHGAHGLAATYLVQKIEIDLLNPANNKLTVGATTLSLTETNKRDLANAMQTVAVETAQAIAEVEQRNMSAIQQSEDAILLTVTEGYYTKGETNQMISSVTTTVEQTAEGIRIDFSNLQQDLNDVQAQADAKFNALQSYIQFAGGDITLGEVGNQVTLKIENDRIGIYHNGVAITYWTIDDFVSPKTLRIPYGGQLILGSFAFIPRSNGSLDFTWVGE